MQLRWTEEQSGERSFEQRVSFGTRQQSDEMFRSDPAIRADTLVSFGEVLVWHVPNRRLGAETLAMQISDVTVDIFLRPVKLAVQTTLRVGNRSNVIYDRFPTHRFSPEERPHLRV
jgi:hypothetical protein